MRVQQQQQHNIPCQVIIVMLSLLFSVMSFAQNIGVSIGMGSNAANISSNAAALDSNAVYIAAHGAQIDSNTIQISSNTAAVAANTAKKSEVQGSASGDMKYWNGSAWVVIPATQNEGATLNMIGGVPTWTGGTEPLPPPPAIGEPYLGGILFYLLQVNDIGYDADVPHGLIAASTDQGTATAWGCYGTEIDGADGTAIGTGAQNTTDILKGCEEAGTAASICRNLNIGGHTEWFLPSKDELDLMYRNIGQGDALGLGNVGGFVSSYYWSSTEFDGNAAWFQGFGIGDQDGFDKRAVRAF